MALVFPAEDLKHDRRVAIRVMRPELGASEGRERFVREIGIAATLSHPHILPVHDSGEADGLHFSVMPFVEDESLRDRLAREGALPLDEAVRLTFEIASALGYAHDRGLVHRDRFDPVTITRPLRRISGSGREARPKLLQPVDHDEEPAALLASPRAGLGLLSQAVR